MSKKPSNSDLFLNSSEYKVLLNPEMFGDLEKGFSDYWTIVKKVAEDNNVVIIENDDPLKLKRKVVSFYDTKNRDLLKNSLLLRYRRKYKNDKPKNEAEYTLKYRTRDYSSIDNVELDLGNGFTPKDDEIEIESDLIFSSLYNGKLDVNYSRANSTVLDVTPIGNIKELEKVFPGIKDLDINGNLNLFKIAEIYVDERGISPGKIDFGNGFECEIDIKVWILRKDEREVIIPEFSFDHSFPKQSENKDEMIEKCSSFMNKVIEFEPKWIIPGRSKSSILFELK